MHGKVNENMHGKVNGNMHGKVNGNMHGIRLYISIVIMGYDVTQQFIIKRYMIVQ